MASSNPSAAVACARRLLAAVAVISLTATVALAQMNTGEIGGIVRDSSGGVLPAATITATHAASGASVERLTDASGRFFLAALRPGAWDLAVRLQGFAPETRRGLVVEIGRTLQLEFTSMWVASPSRSWSTQRRQCCSRPTPS